MKRDFCCHGDCSQGRVGCPLRADRRQGRNLLWLLLGWLMRDRRSGKERRQK